MTFVLPRGGYIAGIVSEPGHAHRHYAIDRRAVGDRYRAPDTRLSSARARDGSWSIAWSDGLVERSWTGVVTPPASGVVAQSASSNRRPVATNSRAEQ
jgi:polyhydroxyalkanoate synthase subunit PhaC